MHGSVTTVPTGAQPQTSENPLALDLLPKEGTEARSLYFGEVALRLIPKTRVADTYFIDRARSALIGLMHGMVAKIHNREDERRYSGLSDSFQDKDASLDMISNWLENLHQKAKQDADPAEAMRLLLLNFVHEAHVHNYPLRCIIETTSLAKMPAKERTGIMNAIHWSLEAYADPRWVARQRRTN